MHSALEVHITVLLICSDEFMLEHSKRVSIACTILDYFPQFSRGPGWIKDASLLHHRFLNSSPSYLSPWSMLCLSLFIRLLIFGGVIWHVKVEHLRACPREWAIFLTTVGYVRYGMLVPPLINQQCSLSADCVIEGSFGRTKYEVFYKWSFYEPTFKSVKVSREKLS